MSLRPNIISREKSIFEKSFKMNMAVQNTNLADYYFDFLKNLNANSKLDLISKLSQSLMKGGNEEEVSLQSLFGAYKSEETAEEIIVGIKNLHFS